MLLLGALGLVPVLLFLAALILLDSFKLVQFRAVALSIAMGALAAGVAMAVNVGLSRHVDPPTLTRYVAPLVEEIAKALWVAWLLTQRRVGFLVDAAIQGFAVGTGFALVENVEYLRVVDGGVVLWFVRGFGTALLHGCTTAIFALWTKTMIDRRPDGGLLRFVPGGFAAFALHSAYNHLALPPAAGVAILVFGFPLLALAAFARSERATREWVGTGLDRDVEILELIETGAISESPAGRYLASLRSRFRGEVVADMLCLMQLRLELGVRAKGILLARQVGLDISPDADVRAKLDELRYLERSIGPIGNLALRPILPPHARESWELALVRR